MRQSPCEGRCRASPILPPAELSTPLATKCGLPAMLSTWGSILTRVRRTRQLTYDIVLMDLGMPTMSGWDAIREITKERGASIHVIAVSAHEDADSRRAAFAAGCHEYIVKPLDVRGAIPAYLYRKRGRPPVDP